MRMITAEECRKAISETLGKSRLRHSLAVAEQAMRLAKRYGCDPAKAEIAGLLHDVAKDFPPERKLTEMARLGVSMDEVTRRSPQLWHAVLGAAWAERELNVTDAEILGGIRYHTTARAGMSRFEQIIYIADYTSADRDYPDAAKMRRIVDTDIDAATREALRYTIAKLAERRLPVHPDSLAAYNEFIIPDPPQAIKL